MDSIHIDKQGYRKLHKLYIQAVRDGKESFMYGNVELVTGYAKYLLMYLEQALRLGKSKVR